MCGIIGAVSHRDVSQMLLEGLGHLEYRGYDSAGIALVNTASDQLERIRIQGKVRGLVQAMSETTVSGSLGIAHTRWATHGKPCEQNAHPHLSEEVLALVHNGIIENYELLRERLQKEGYQFISETDTEVAAHLVHFHYQQHEDLLRALQDAAEEMQGAFALGVIHQHRPFELVAIRKGCPLILGLGTEEQFIASDVVALRPFAQSIIYLEEGDSVYLNAKKATIFNAARAKVERKIHRLEGNDYVVNKGGYRHFMLKEINEQSNVLIDTLDGRIASQNVLKASFGERTAALFSQVKNIHIVACGTSYHAGLIAKYWLESLTGLATQVEIASEYRYRDVVVNDQTLFITVSQSGETADTLAALYKAKTLNYLGTLAICNVATSTMVHEADCTFLTRAGIEIGVASTKAFTTQLAAFLMLAAALSNKEVEVNNVLAELKALPGCCERALKMNEGIKNLAPLFVPKAHALFLGRGMHYPVALEGALKLKEISYIHAEAYPAGELKHGPLALIDEEMPVIAVAPNDELLDKLKSNLHEVKSRGGQLIVFAENVRDWKNEGTQLIQMPKVGPWTSPILYTIPLQLLAYHVAVLKGTDVDQPRNLAKSVTVE